MSFHPGDIVTVPREPCPACGRYNETYVGVITGSEPDRGRGFYIGDPPYFVVHLRGSHGGRLVFSESVLEPALALEDMPGEFPLLP